MNPLFAQYRAIIVATAWAAAVVLVVGALWWVYSTIWQRGADSVQAKWDRAVVLAQLQAEKDRRAQAAVIASVDAAHTADLKEKTDEIADLRARLATGAVRLRVAARCPAFVPPAPAGAGVGAGEADRPDPVAGPTGDAYLDPAAEPAYFALKEGLARQLEQLRACQEILVSERAP